ncbi:MAG: hypothetical protein ABH879_09360 [archaeon]
MNRKALMSFNMLMWIPRIIFLTAVVLSVILLVRVFVVTGIDTKGIEAGVFMDRVWYSANGISYRDPYTGRAYPGIIDTGRFNDLILNSTMQPPQNRLIAARLELTGSETREVFYNKLWYERWKEVPFEGIGGSTMFTMLRPVIIRSGPADEAGYLKMEVFVPNK